MFSTSLHFKTEVNWISTRKLFILVPSCGCVSGEKFHVLKLLPFPKYQFAHTLNWSLPKNRAFQSVHLLPQQGFEVSQIVCTRRFKAHVTK